MLRLALCVAAVATTSLSMPVRREVPQEHSHEQFLTTVRASLNLNNPDAIKDPVFGLLGDAAASQGLGKITDPDCLQQATADQAFTNAKKASDVNGQVAALIYRALERNTGKVGQASVACTSIKAVNAEIAAISQHQDPASSGAAATNKAITLELAKQIKAVGGDPQLALKSGTFAPGDPNDNTGKGNSCDDANDKVGCIFTQNLLVEDATPAEIDAAVGGAGAADAAAATSGNSNKGAAAEGSCPAAVTVTVDAAEATSAATATPDATSNAGAVQNTGKLSFGKCKNPSVIFAAGIDGRKSTEFAFEPADLTQFKHGSALNPDIIFQFNCDTLVNACGLTNADASVIACRAAQKKADGLGKTGAAADSFNHDLGFNTNFAALDSAASVSAAPAAAPAAATAAPNKPAAANKPAANSSSASQNTGKLSFGKCKNPSVIFAAGIDGRKPTEFAFQPADLTQFNHGSALNPDIIFQFNCDTLVNACGLTNADASVIACRAAQKKADALGKTGAAADSFNKDLGFNTDFAALDKAAATTAA